jgi:hypothetical protein
LCIQNNGTVDPLKGGATWQQNKISQVMSR